MAKKKSVVKSKAPSAASLIEKALEKKSGWQPPAEILPALIKIVEHNSKELETAKSRIGSRQVKKWLAENGVQVGVEGLRRWMLETEKKFKQNS